MVRWKPFLRKLPVTDLGLTSGQPRPAKVAKKNTFQNQFTDYMTLEL